MEIENKISNKMVLQLELLTVLMICIVLAIIYIFIQKYFPGFDFLFENLLSAGVFLVLVRYIFGMNVGVFNRRIIPKAMAMILVLFLFLFLFYRLRSYMIYYSEHNIELLTVSGLTYEQSSRLGKILHTQIMFFMVAALCAIPVFFIRALLSIWRNLNTDRN